MSARGARTPPAPPDELAPALEAALLRHLEDAEAFGDRAEHARAAREYEAALGLAGLTESLRQAAERHEALTLTLTPTLALPLPLSR